jgi:electron transport complex protein RnfD
MTWLFGWGTLFNLMIAIPAALLAEAAVLKARGYNVRFALRDWSAVVTAVLLALAIPPTSPWWLIVIGIIAAIVVAKQLYGGLGMNPFNPAMVGYVVLLISFPLEMTRWIGPHEAPSWFDSFRMVLASANVDAFTGATPLDSFRTWAGNAEQLQALPILHGEFASLGWEWVNIAFLIGGLYLLARKIISWHIPVAMLAGMALIALPFWLFDDARYASPLFHLFSGAAMFGAFFIATDPVSAATSRYGRLIYGALIGVLVWIIRSHGGYPDAVAFAVLLMNLAAPTIDYYTQPRTYGHHRAKRGATR